MISYLLVWALMNVLHERQYRAESFMTLCQDKQEGKRIKDNGYGICNNIMKREQIELLAKLIFQIIQIIHWLPHSP